MAQRMIRAIGTSIGVALFLTGCGDAGTESEAAPEPEAAADAPATVMTRETTLTRETTPPQDAECKAGQRQYRGEERSEYRCEDGNWIDEDGNRFEEDGNGIENATWESECPGTKRQVIYNGESTAGYGDMTAAFPGGTRQSSPDLPMRLTGDTSAQGMHFCVSAGEFLYVSLQNPKDTGSIECSITVDGKLISRNSSSGGYVIASCDGTA